MNIIKLLIPNFMATLLAAAGGVQKTIQKIKSRQKKNMWQGLALRVHS